MRAIYEECGVIGVWHPQAVSLSVFGLVALQHRGQESAGIVWNREGELELKKGMGLVEDVFRGWQPETVTATAAIGHVRYATSGDSNLVNGQPLLFKASRLGPLALAHNGNLVNAEEIRTQLELQGSIFQTGTDSEVIAHLLARSTTDLDSALVSALGQVRGAYALVLLTPKHLLAIRDPHGIRPLVVGRLGQGWVVASETCALDAMGAKFVREVEPGELISITDSGLEATSLLPAKKPGFCIFEYIYFARPDSVFAGGNVHSVRRQMGRLLAREAPADADIVTGVPDSSLSAAAGYAEGSGLPYETGLIRNRYLGRTFIRPTQEQRNQGVSLKLNPIEGVVAGKRVVLVDDSLVRGTTSKRIVTMLREAGAREVHLRIASPPVRYPCGLGIDTRDDLVAGRMDVETIREYINADSLVYLSEEQTVAATCLGAGNVCTGCFSGNHPVRRS